METGATGNPYSASTRRASAVVEASPNPRAAGVPFKMMNAGTLAAVMMSTVAPIALRWPS